MRQIDSYTVNILDKTKNFSVRVIRFSSQLPKNPAGFTIADQLVRSTCSVGANLIEAQEAVSQNDFIYKINISLKEAKETKYWLELIKFSDLLSGEEISYLLHEAEEIVKILIAILKKLRLKKQFSIR